MIEGVRRNAGQGTSGTMSDHLRELMALDDPAAPKLSRESIYSMDGDFGPIEAICELQPRFGALTFYIDEVHAVRRYGPTRGRGCGT